MPKKNRNYGRLPFYLAAANSFPAANTTKIYNKRRMKCYPHSSLRISMLIVTVWWIVNLVCKITEALDIPVGKNGSENGFQITQDVERSVRVLQFHEDIVSRSTSRHLQDVVYDSSTPYEIVIEAGTTFFGARTTFKVKLFFYADCLCSGQFLIHGGSLDTPKPEEVDPPPPGAPSWKGTPGTVTDKENGTYEWKMEREYDVFTELDISLNIVGKCEMEGNKYLPKVSIEKNKATLNDLIELGNDGVDISFEVGDVVFDQDLGVSPPGDSNNRRSLQDLSSQTFVNFTWKKGEPLCNICIFIADMKGDPHLTSWNGDRFDFHGECDIVLASVASLDGADAQGLDVHARTTMVSNSGGTLHEYSYISEAAVKIGDQVLSVDRTGYWLDGSYKSFDDLLDDGSSPVFYLSGYKSTMSDSQTKKGRFMKKIQIEINNEEYITIKAAKTHIDVSISSIPGGSFHESVGLLGRHSDGALVDRNGNPMPNSSNENDYGQMWQVREWEDMLFPQARSPQHPIAKCILPKDSSATKQRYLRDTSVNNSNSQKIHEAEETCAQVKHSIDRDNCVFDVLATGDPNMADSYIEF